MHDNYKTTTQWKPEPQAQMSGTGSSTQRVYLELRDRIIQGDIAPGERLKVDSLKTLLDVGATPIREALSLLTSDQLVERLDQRGFRAAAASEKNFQEILTLRCQLEGIALANSIKHGNSEWEEQLVLCHHRLTQVDSHIHNDKENSTSPTNPESAARHDPKPGPVHKAQPDPAPNPRNLRREREQQHKAFHMMLLQAGDSPVLFRFCNQLYDLNIRYRFLAGESVEYARRDVAAEHTAILHAVINRDTELAVDTLLDHYRKTGVFLTGQLAPSGASVRSKSTSE